MFLIFFFIMIYFTQHLITVSCVLKISMIIHLDSESELTSLMKTSVTTWLNICLMCNSIKLKNFFFSSKLSFFSVSHFSSFLSNWMQRSWQSKYLWSFLSNFMIYLIWFCESSSVFLTALRFCWSVMTLMFLNLSEWVLQHKI